jgi:predicted DNA-binding WGR domain protein
MAKLTRHEASKNLHRFYALHIAPSLFGKWLPVVEMGQGRIARNDAASAVRIRALAETALCKCLRAKAGCGYLRDTR